MFEKLKQPERLLVRLLRKRTCKPAHQDSHEQGSEGCRGPETTAMRHRIAQQSLQPMMADFR